MDKKWHLPSQIDHLLRLVALKYKKTGDDLLRKLIVNCSFSIIECTDYDNWNGGTAGHDIELVIPEPLYLEVLENKTEFENKISSEINEIKSIENEFIRKTSIGTQAKEDWRFDHSDVRLAKLKKSIPKESVKRIWQNSNSRLFLSHKVKYKKQAEALKEELHQYGISSFVAHTSIRPTKEWLDEIENALLTMDAFIALLTDDFQESEWTDQEVGFAISRRVPIIPISLTGKDPHGFMEKYQKMNGSFDDVPKLAADIYAVLAEDTPLADSLKNAMINSFVKSPSFMDSKEFIEKKLSNLKSLSDEQINKIKKGYSANDQLHGCYVVNRDLPNLLFKISGRKFTVQGERLIEAGERK